MESYGEKINSLSQNLKEIAQRHSLNSSLLQNFTEQEFELVVDMQISKNKDKENIRRAFEEYRIFCQPNMSNGMRVNAIHNDNKPAKKFLEKITKGEIIHYYYLPQDAYRANGIKSNGLIIDLQEIEELPLEDAMKIQTPGIDYMLLPLVDEQQRARLINRYWLETDKDFVAEDGVISSPWREHLMQRFSNGFIRIGVDGATVDEYHQLVSEI